MTNEAFERVKIDQPLKDADWSPADGRSVSVKCPLTDSGKVAYTLFNRQGPALAARGTKRASLNPGAGGAQKVLCANA